MVRCIYEVGSIIQNLMATRHGLFPRSKLWHDRVLLKTLIFKPIQSIFGNFPVLNGSCLGGDSDLLYAVDISNLILAVCSLTAICGRVYTIALLYFFFHF